MIENNPQLIIQHSSTKTIGNILYMMFLTKNCYRISLSVMSIICSWLLYTHLTLDYGDFSLIKLESEDSMFWLFIWQIISITIIVLWNFYLFIFTSVFKYEYTQGNGTVISSFVEDLYCNPIFFLIMIYHINSHYLQQAIDNSFWVLIIFHYFFISFHLTQFFKNIDKEIASITNLYSESTRSMLPKIKRVSLFFIFINGFFSFLVYLIINELDLNFKCIILGKGVYIMIKTIDLWITRANEVEFLQYEMNTKEIYLIPILNTKTILEMVIIVYVFYQFIVVYIFAESQPFYFTVISVGIILSQAYNGLLYYKRSKILREYYRDLDYSLKKKNTVDDDCVICAEKLDNGRILECKHVFHYICLSKLIEKGHKTCPICRKDIATGAQESAGLLNAVNQRQRRVFSFGVNLNSSLFNWFPNISMRIIRFNSVTVGTENNLNLLNMGNNPNINMNHID